MTGKICSAIIGILISTVSKTQVPCVNYALSFDGTNWVGIADAPSLRPCPTCPFTVELWARRESANSIQHIIGKRVGCTDPSNYYQMAFDPALNFGGVHTSVILPMNEWHHLAAVFNGANYFFYYDGVPVATAQGTIGSGAGAGLKIAGSGDCFGQYFIGQIDKVLIWNAARTQLQIQNDMIKCINGTEEGLAGVWDFDEGAGSVAHDLSPNKNDGLLTNNPQWVISTLPCCSAYNCNMTVDAGPDKSTFFGDPLREYQTITAIVTGGTDPLKYNWQLDRTLLPGESIKKNPDSFSVTVRLKDTAMICITVRDAIYCTATDCAMIFAQDVSDQYSNAGFSIFPNPNNGNFTVNTNFSGGGIIIRIINMLGQTVKYINPGQQTQVDISLAQSGMYIVQIAASGYIISKKLIVIY